MRTYARAEVKIPLAIITWYVVENTKLEAKEMNLSMLYESKLLGNKHTLLLVFTQVISCHVFQPKQKRKSLHMNSTQFPED